MEFLADSWVLWLVLSGACIAGVFFYRKSRRMDAGYFVTAKDLSVRTLMLDVRKGDGDIFLGFLLSMFFFSLFLAGFVRWIRSIF